MNRAETNQALMKQFETMINTADEELSRKLISEKASFFTPASPVPLYGGKGYLSVVHWMRQGFSDVQWKLEEMVAAENFYYFDEDGKIINDIAAEGMIGILRGIGAMA